MLMTVLEINCNMQLEIVCCILGGCETLVAREWLSWHVLRPELYLSSV